MSAAGEQALAFKRWTNGIRSAEDDRPNDADRKRWFGQFVSGWDDYLRFVDRRREFGQPGSMSRSAYTAGRNYARARLVKGDADEASDE